MDKNPELNRIATKAANQKILSIFLSTCAVILGASIVVGLFWLLLKLVGWWGIFIAIIITIFGSILISCWFEEYEKVMKNGPQ